MARVNITIPDELYYRFNKLRDRVNLSKLAAKALESELNHLEVMFADSNAYEENTKVYLTREGFPMSWE